jgi:hypothetical protein
MLSFHERVRFMNKTKVQWLDAFRYSASVTTCPPLLVKMLKTASTAAHRDLVHRLANDIQSTNFNSMPFEKFDLQNLDKERRKAIAKSIRTVSVEELKAIGEEVFKYADDPWREAFFRFIAENPGCTFHHAIMSDGVNIVYCRDQDKGMWFLPGSGLGPLQATGRLAMKEIIEGGR